MYTASKMIFFFLTSQLKVYFTETNMDIILSIFPSSGHLSIVDILSTVPRVPPVPALHCYTGHNLLLSKYIILYAHRTPGDLIAYSKQRVFITLTQSSYYYYYYIVIVCTSVELSPNSITKEFRLGISAS